MKKKIKVACLPVAGIENPYQYLMINGLNKHDCINSFNGVDDRFFGIFRTWLKYRPDYIHFDWIDSYYKRKNILLTVIFLPFFLLQIIFIRIFSKSHKKN